MWRQYTKSFRAALESGGKTTTTITAYLGDLDQFSKFLKRSKINGPVEVKTENIGNFLKSLRAKNYSIKSISRKLNTIRTFYRILNVTKELKANPAASIKHPRIKGQPPRVLSETEYMALKEASRPNIRLFAIVELLLQTGMKIGEVCRLELDDLKMKSNKPVEVFIKEYNRVPGRWIPLNSKAAVALHEYLKIRTKTTSEAVFVSGKGHPVRIRNLRTYIMNALRKAGIEGAKVNDLRATMIAQQLKRGANLVTISQIVGHRRISTTEKYLDLLQKPEQSSKPLPEL